MASRRTYGSYDDGCAAAHALDLIGERWSLIVVRELMLGPKRFTDLRSGVLGASANVLSQRLRDLEEAGIVRRVTLGPPARAQVYELTEWGLELEPVLRALGRWGVRSPAMPHGAQVSNETTVLSMRTMLEDVPLGDVKVRLELRLGKGDVIRIDTTDGLVIERGSAADPDAVVTAESTVFTSMAFYGRDLDEAIDAGDATVDGDPNVVRRFLGLLPALT
ncbi:winged helix-turn-helix transcriptional regulator [Rhodococcus sp. USK10]|uniref:winged helix-turn-helix transcriptional regulator n=1 Tax=Rhodococcus sp. USK10 TaxID=2789739 RepID=UPI001C5DC474|nr:winged helix-turn-helix transcriptional regulator [Rhodococcus sp. USK10]QYB07617.1 winged helix-turn-helix transcriptional regulator [Rhodococcus sp. USK10]